MYWQDVSDVYPDVDEVDSLWRQVELVVLPLNGKKYELSILFCSVSNKQPIYNLFVFVTP